MSLAEPRKKQRIVADPQNKKWAEDKGGFGFKMLQKMGWKEGSGLGISGDGMIEHIKVSVKKDAVGLGADRKAVAADASGHLQTYEELLRQMNADVECEKKKEKKSSRKDSKMSKSERRLEKVAEKESKKSKSSKKEKDKADETKAEKSTVSINRLAHRKKYRSNKDVSGYSAAQLKEIFGV